MVPFFVFVNVQLTFSPAARLIATPVSPASNRPLAPIVTVLLVAPVQTMFVSTQPAGTVSLEVYVPGCSAVAVTVPLLVETVPFGVPVNVNVPVPPWITFVIVMDPFFVFVKVQLTFSPAARLIATPVSPASNRPLAPIVTVLLV